MNFTRIPSLCRAALCSAAAVALAGDGIETKYDIAFAQTISVPAGFSIELVAGPPLVERPIVGAFDDDGRLYVAESSGSNDPVEKQLAEKPHRIVRLEDVDGDGKYDKRVVFADRMMFPEGAMFLDGSLYVSAPPSIWKLTDTNGDGVADQRVEWFQGKTLTGCANDLHGPYAGIDGWIYWCKGAFAEQTHVVNGREFKSKAAHIFRCRPDGTGLEPVMTGGMDNPVDVVFTPEGERIFSTTLIVGSGRRDALVHAIYGGVYGKEHGVLAGHPRTGELMPAMVLMSPTAPCGLERYESDAFGEEYRDNLFAAQFNVRKVSRHVLRPSGSTWVSEDSDFVVSDHVDFHPTDVLMDADGSLLVIDTGGWYKLCCPTSQLWKPDVLGGIYRARRVGAASAPDPRGREIDWKGQGIEELWELLADERPAVRQRATREFAIRRGSAEMESFLAALARRGVIDAVSIAGLPKTWALVQLETPQAQALVRQLLDHPDEKIRHAAMSAASLERDAAALPKLLELLASDTPPNQRVAAEAIGRLGDRSAVPALLAAAANAEDRILQHSITYALIELADPAAMAAGLSSEAPGTIAAALVSLDQMPGDELEFDHVSRFLGIGDERLAATVRWIVAQHPEWAGPLSAWFRQMLSTASESHESPNEAEVKGFRSLLATFAEQPHVQVILAEALSANRNSELALQAVVEGKVRKPSGALLGALAKVIAKGEPALLPQALAVVRQLQPELKRPAELEDALLAVAGASEPPLEQRVAALAVVTPGLPELSESQFAMLVQAVATENAVVVRSAAADALSQAPLTPEQLGRLCDSLATASPLELNRLLPPFARSADDALGLRILASLKGAAALSSLRVDLLRQALAKYSLTVQRGVDELESLVNVDAGQQRRRIEELLPLMAHGDVRRGHAVFYSSKAACSACHQLGYAGGTVGPELSRIGETRSERDLLESILYPSLSFVRSYEPVLVLTVDGKAINGAVRDETETEYVLATGPDQETRIRREDVEEIQPSTVSVMPAGLEKQLSVEELADLVAFLKNARED
jgi:putative membrane-bound dehydrogenase-like protein